MLSDSNANEVLGLWRFNYWRCDINGKGKKTRNNKRVRKN